MSVDAPYDATERMRAYRKRKRDKMLSAQELTYPNSVPPLRRSGFVDWRENDESDNELETDEAEDEKKDPNEDEDDMDEGESEGEGVQREDGRIDGDMRIRPGLEGEDNEYEEAGDYFWNEDAALISPRREDNLRAVNVADDVNEGRCDREDLDGDQDMLAATAGESCAGVDNAAAFVSPNSSVSDVEWRWYVSRAQVMAILQRRVKHVVSLINTSMPRIGSADDSAPPSNADKLFTSLSSDYVALLKFLIGIFVEFFADIVELRSFAPAGVRMPILVPNLSTGALVFVSSTAIRGQAATTFGNFVRSCKTCLYDASDPEARDRRPLGVMSKKNVDGYYAVLCEPGARCFQYEVEEDASGHPRVEIGRAGGGMQWPSSPSSSESESSSKSDAEEASRPRGSILFPISTWKVSVEILREHRPNDAENPLPLAVQRARKKSMQNDDWTVTRIFSAVRLVPSATDAAAGGVRKVRGQGGIAPTAARNVQSTVKEIAASSVITTMPGNLREFHSTAEHRWFLLN